MITGNKKRKTNIIIHSVCADIGCSIINKSVVDKREREKKAAQVQAVVIKTRARAPLFFAPVFRYSML